MYLLVKAKRKFITGLVHGDLFQTTQMSGGGGEKE